MDKILAFVAANWVRIAAVLVLVAGVAAGSIPADWALTAIRGM